MIAVLYTTFSMVFGLVAGGVSLTVIAVKGIVYSLSLRKQLADNYEVVKEVRDRLNHEMAPNDGASLRDAVDRLEKETTRVSNELKEFKKLERL